VVVSFRSPRTRSVAFRVPRQTSIGDVDSEEWTTVDGVVPLHRAMLKLRARDRAQLVVFAM
jgi:hypothetical protein